MSGLCGHLRFRGAPVSPADIDRQLATLEHRGPDRRKSWRRGSVALGHLLLRVTPEDLLEAQPLADTASGLVIVADLRLDNRTALAGALDLSAADIQDWPDSRLLLAAWKRWGVACLDRLIGDFAIAVWDERARRLTLARDPMGQRPLYFHQGPDFLAFASEIKGLWAMGDVPRELDESFLAARVADYHIGLVDRTPYPGIRMLRGGGVLSVDADGVTRESVHWEPRPDPAMLNRPEGEYYEAYRAVLGEAVRCRLRGAKPAALILSGGFDSGSIAALAGPVLNPFPNPFPSPFPNQDGRGGRRLIGLTSVLPPGPAPEIHQRCARVWVERYARDMPHLDLRLLDAPGDHALRGLEAAFAIHDGLMVAVTHYAYTDMMRTAAAAGARTIMDGHGGDYTLNPRGFGFLPSLLRRGQPLRFLREFAAYRRTSGQTAAQTLRRQVLRPVAPDWLIDLRERWRGGGEHAIMRSLVRPEFARTMAAADRHPPWPWPPDYRMRERSLGILRMICRLSVVPENNLAARHGLDLTRPFHDRRVVELGLAIPEDLYVRNGWERHVARTAMKGLLPVECQTRDRGNEGVAPDFYARHQAMREQISAELARLRQSNGAHLLDYDRADALLTLDPRHKDVQFAMMMGVHAAMVGRFLEWFRRPN